MEPNTDQRFNRHEIGGGVVTDQDDETFLYFGIQWSHVRRVWYCIHCRQVASTINYQKAIRGIEHTSGCRWVVVYNRQVRRGSFNRAAD